FVVTHERDVTKLEAIKAPFPRMSYDEAVKTPQAKGSEIQWGGDFGGTDGKLLSQDFDRPLMVDGYPAAVKAFYMAPDPVPCRTPRSEEHTSELQSLTNLVC